MRKGLIYLASFAAAFLLAGCGVKEAEEGQIPEQSVETEIGAQGEAEAEPEQEGTKEEVTEQTSSNISMFTGLPVSEEVMKNRPLAVMFNNIKEGCPQTGIASADLVYEAPVEGRITRLMGIFEDYKNIEKIGSIRSSRDYFVYFAMEYDAIYAHFGQATLYVGSLLNSDKVDNISGAVAGIDRPATKSFYRSEDRKAPHNVYISAEGLQKDLEKFGYRLTKKDDLKKKFQFVSEETPYYFPYSEDATVLYPGGKETNKKNGFSKVGAKFEYNPEDQLYYRYQYGGEHIDEATGEQLAYSNVIFQYCKGEVRDKNDYLAFGCHGNENRMIRVFTQGKMIPGVWSRMSDEEPAQYIDYEGNPITLTPGKTWICIIWDEYRDDVVYE